MRIDEHRVGLLKPETYMNESGRSVQAAAAFYKLEPDAILVVHDESDLESGRLQARIGGGLAGHNGLRSIAAQLGTPDFLRLRVGVGRPERGDRRPLADYVLSDFEPHEDAEAIVARAAAAVETLDAEGLEAAQRQFNASEAPPDLAAVRLSQLKGRRGEPPDRVMPGAAVSCSTVPLPTSRACASRPLRVEGLSSDQTPPTRRARARARVDEPRSARQRLRGPPKPVGTPWLARAAVHKS